MMLLFLIVLILWAMERVVFPPMMASRLFCTTYSLFWSRAEVASSNNSILGYLRMALAMANLCFYPPEILLPLLPTSRSKPCPSCFPSSSSSSTTSNLSLVMNS